MKNSLKNHQKFVKLLFRSRLPNSLVVGGIALIEARKQEYYGENGEKLTYTPKFRRFGLETIVDPEKNDH